MMRAPATSCEGRGGGARTELEWGSSAHAHLTVVSCTMISTYRSCRLPLDCITPLAGHRIMQRSCTNDPEVKQATNSPNGSMYLQNNALKLLLRKRFYFIGLRLAWCCNPVNYYYYNTACPTGPRFQHTIHRGARYRLISI